MTSLEIIEKVDDIFRHQWNEENALSVPEAESVALISNHAKLIDGTVLYADLNDSTALVDGHKHWFAAEIYKSYLLSASQIIKDNNGEITAFDGDRVMGVFIGDRKNSSAVKAALQINFIVMKINDKIKERYPDSTYKLKQSIGIDTSKLFVARTGVR
ncbi:MAG: adenylate/guanylate cyclase domain-containing protein, partial [bacterium]|nr:adenylate/guanylate cyclase domain-containing protein [bacterium]